MDIALRILHIVFGTFWVGASILSLFFLEPRFRSISSAFESRAMRAILPVVSPAFGLSSLVILGTGIAMAIRLRGSDLSIILATGWGIAMLIAFIATVAAIVVGFGFSAPKGMRLIKLERKMKGREPNTDEAHEIERILDNVQIVERINIVLIMIALISMPVARFV